MEANLFTSVATADNLISFAEGIEWFYIVLSGSAIADRFHERLKSDSSCQIPGSSPDSLGRERVKVECFRSQFFAWIDSELIFLPEMRRYVLGLDDAGRATFLQAIENSARVYGAIEGPTDSSELRAVVPILSYIESLFLRFDVNRSGVLETAEVWNAYPLISPFLRRVVGNDSSDTILRSVFSYLIYYGVPPTPTQAVTWVVRRQFVNETATRLDLLKVVAALNEHGRKQRVESLRNWVTQTTNPRERFQRNVGRARSELRELAGCLVESSSTFERAVLARMDRVFPRDPGRSSIDVDAMILGLRDVVDSDRDLSPVCSPP